MCSVVCSLLWRVLCNVPTLQQQRVSNRKGAVPAPEEAPPHAFIHRVHMQPYATCALALLGSFAFTVLGAFAFTLSYAARWLPHVKMHTLVFHTLVFHTLHT